MREIGCNKFRERALCLAADDMNKWLARNPEFSVISIQETDMRINSSELTVWFYLPTNNTVKD